MNKIRSAICPEESFDQYKLKLITNGYEILTVERDTSQLLVTFTYQKVNRVAKETLNEGKECWSQF